LLSFDEEKLATVLKGFLSKAVNPVDILNRTAAALREVGVKYEKGALYLVHLVAGQRHRDTAARIPRESQEENSR
jgi:methanogenic corrinoid protein MtbC1